MGVVVTLKSNMAVISANSGAEHSVVGEIVKVRDLELDPKSNDRYKLLRYVLVGKILYSHCAPFNLSSHSSQLLRRHETCARLASHSMVIAMLLCFSCPETCHQSPGTKAAHKASSFSVIYNQFCFRELGD